MHDTSWQGNVRELNHVIERAVLMAQDQMVRPAIWPCGRRAAVRRGWRT